LGGDRAGGGAPPLQRRRGLAHAEDRPADAAGGLRIAVAGPRSWFWRSAERRTAVVRGRPDPVPAIRGDEARARVVCRAVLSRSFEATARIPRGRGSH